METHKCWYSPGLSMGPILYIIYTKDISNIIKIPHTKFADDLSIWISHLDVSVIEWGLESNLKDLVKWANKWRQAINFKKTREHPVYH